MTSRRHPVIPALRDPAEVTPAKPSPAVTEVTTAKVSLTELEGALCAALAWGRAYGSVINRHQWEEMRDSQIRMHMAKLLGLTVEQVQLQHRCKSPATVPEGQAIESKTWRCVECNQAWKWNGTGWYKVTTAPPEPKSEPYRDQLGNIRQPCPTCNGTGSGAIGPCKMCEGMGIK